MTYKQGRFYDNLGNPVALEHGNKDQIALIHRAEALRAGVVYPQLGSFDCLCGSLWKPVFEDGKKFKCPECNQKYELYKETDDEYGFVEIPCIKTV
jgi:hypothetical protein